MPTCCLRGGCLTGPNHSGVELHGFLSYLVRCNVEDREYKVFGYKGKQVRDNIHSEDVAGSSLEFCKAPRCGEVYNLGGGKENSCSILEAFQLVESFTGKPPEATPTWMRTASATTSATTVTCEKSKLIFRTGPSRARCRKSSARSSIPGRTGCSTDLPQWLGTRLL